jgi:hypothetical protein
MAMYAPNDYHMQRKLGGKTKWSIFLRELAKKLIEKYSKLSCSEHLKATKLPKCSHILERHISDLIPTTTQDLTMCCLQ